MSVSGSVSGDRSNMTAASTTSAVEARGLRKQYGHGDGAVHALRGLDLQVAAGSFTAVMGPSGSGKSTLLHCLSGLDAPTSGEVVLGGVEITALGEQALTRLRRAQVGFVFQSFNLVPELTGGENIALPVQLGGHRPDPDWLAQVVELLGIGERLTHRPAQLSGGQTQRVAIARALITRPAVIFADEPTGNLDRRAGGEVLALLARCAAELDQTVVMVTHDPAAAAHTGRVLFLADGHLAGELTDPSTTAILESLAALESSAESGAQR